MQIQRGAVSERPFARLIYNVARQRFTGDLVLLDGAHTYRTSWEDGRVVAADSPASSDSLARVARSSGLASSTVLGQFLDHMRAQPKADELEVMASLARLRPEQILILKKDLLAQRAQRQFALPNAEYALNNARSMSADPHVPPIDPRWLIFHGLKSHYQLERLEREMAPVFGSRFRVADDAGVNIASFAFSPSEMAAVRRLGAPMSVNELSRASTELDRATVLSVVYALVATDCLEPAGQAHALGKRQPKQANPLTEPAARKITSAEIDAMRAGRKSAHPSIRDQQATTVAPPAERPKRKSKASMTFSRRQRVATGVNLTSPEKIRPSDVKKLVAEKARLVDERADHFRLLGVSFNSDEREVRRAYFDLAKRLHPDRLQALDLSEVGAEAQRVFATINLAFAVLSDRRQLARYRASLESAVGSRQFDEADAEQIAAAIFAAEDAFRLGQMALRRKHLGEAVESFEKAVELNPDEGEHHAFLAWARFCYAPDKAQVIKDVNRGFAKAVEISPNNPNNHMLRGHFARQIGDQTRAERYYRRVLSLDPQNSEAQLNLRLLSSG